MSSSVGDSARGWRHRIRKSVLLGLSAFLLLVCSLSILGLAADAFWPFYFLDQLRVHYAVFLGFGGVVLLFRRRWVLSALVLATLALNIYLLYPVLWLAPVSGSSTPSLALLHANLGRQRTVPEALINYLKRTEVHLLHLQEVTPAFLESANTDLPGYRVLLAEPRPDTKGVAVFAAHDLPVGVRIQSSRIERLAGDVADRSSVALELAWDEQPLRLLSFHCIRPGAGNKLAIHRAEYDALVEWFRAVPNEPALAIGDFNATPWSQRVRTTLRATGLPRRQDALAVRPTWPSGPLLAVGLPIDLCVHNAHVRVSQSEVGPDIGSDHLPLYCLISPVSAD